MEGTVVLTADLLSETMFEFKFHFQNNSTSTELSKSETALSAGPPKISIWFFPLPPQFTFFLHSLWGLLAGASHDRPRTPNVHI